MQVVTSRCGRQPEKLAGIGLGEFTVLVRQAVAGWGGKRPASVVCRAVFAALASTEGVVVSHRLLRRCADELGDLQRTRAQLRAVEADMVAVLGELGLSRLADIPGLTAVGAAAILAETGDPAGMTAHHRWPGTPGCPRPVTPQALSRARRTSPAGIGWSSPA